MKFKLYRSFGALNSVPVFNAFEQGLITLGHQIVDSDEDIPVIWSVLWNGRMINNQQVYNKCIKEGKPIIIIEVGNLKRGITWRVSFQHVNSHGIFANTLNLDQDRPNKLGVGLRPVKHSRRDEILIACQHPKSLQWEGQPAMPQWIRNTIRQIRQYSKRRIVVRPHPRALLAENFVDAFIEVPKKLINTYDDFDINYNYHCVINHNAGPAVQAVMHGTPTICDSSSLAYPVSEKWENLENPQIPDREEWFLKLCHTEWTVEEMAQGIPQQRLIAHLSLN